MVDEALIACFLEKTPAYDDDKAWLEERLRLLLAFDQDEETARTWMKEGKRALTDAHLIEETEVGPLIEAIDTLKVLDPACGSGAFPMGVLHKLVLILAKIDPQNERWKERQVRKARAIEDPEAREKVVAAVESAFAPERGFGDFGRKLYLIQNGIFGVDIQPVACQIAKLRFFISLVVEQQTTKTPSDNYGIRPLPNLETRFIAADTLIGLGVKQQEVLGNDTVRTLEDRLRWVRESYFNARTRDTKRDLRKKDGDLRAELAGVLKGLGFGHDNAEAVAHWDPYDQNARASWFDSEWMFGIGAGFDVVIGNPPYVESRNSLLSSELKDSYSSQVLADWGESLPRGSDLLIYFYSRSVRFLNNSGCGCFITQNAWLSTDYGQKFQQFSLEKLSFESITDTSSKFFSDTSSQNINAIITMFHKRRSTNILYRVVDSDMQIISKKSIQSNQTMK